MGMKKHHRSSASFYFNFLIINLSIYFVMNNIVGAVRQEIRCPVESLYQLGDSISDTGNGIRLFPIAVSHRPFGQTFPGYPSGRWSDGRLIIDYIAMALGLPLLKPYLAKNASNVDNGVNFAVAGSTALDSSFFLAKGTLAPLPSLTVQLAWFKKYIKSAYSTPTERADKLSRSMVFVGESGYNDIALSILQGRSLQQVYTYIPSLVQVTINTAREVIKSGASQVIVPGNFPLGCFPWALLSALASHDPSSYDEIGCLKSLNNLTSLMNKQLQEALDFLRNEFPNVVILYGDYYNIFHSLLREASTLGFDTRVLLKPCCGEGKYTPSSLKFCGNLGASVCPNPNIYIHWDGVHLTQEAYRRMSEILIKDLNINCTR